MMNAVLPWTILVPVLGALLMPLFRNAAGWCALLLAVVLATLNGYLYMQSVTGTVPGFSILEPVAGVRLALHVEPLGVLFALIASVLWIPTAVYTLGYVRVHHLQQQPRFHACFALALGATMGVAYSANLLTIFVFYELLTLTTWPLVSHEGTPEALRAGRRYLVYLLGTSMSLLLLAIVCVWQWGGTLDFLPGGVPGALPTVLFLLFVFGAGKAAMVPLHSWLPGAMVAPAPVSALLHAVAVVKAGVFVILKVAVYTFGLQRLAGSDGAMLAMYAAVFTVVVASVLALRSDHLKQRLAYSTIAQLACIVIGAALANQFGLLGGGMHMLTHAFGKITLFFCAGTIAAVAHLHRVSELDGTARHMPWTQAAFLVASLSVIGLPPGGGTWSKWLLVQGAVEAGAWLPILAIAFSTLCSVLYLLEIPARAFLRPAPTVVAMAEAPLLCRIGFISTAAVCTGLFLFPEPAWLLLCAI